MDQHPGPRKRSASRSFTILWVAIILILLFWIETFVVGLLEASQGYSHFDHAISLLTIADPPLGTIHRVSFIMLGSATFGFAYLTNRMGRTMTLAKGVLIALLLVHGIGRVAEGVFIGSPGASGSLSNMLHTSIGMLGVLAMVPAPFIGARVAAQAWQETALQRISLTFGLVFIILFVIGVVLSLVPLGLGQRIGFLTWYAWLIYFGVRITSR